MRYGPYFLAKNWACAAGPAKSGKIKTWPKAGDQKTKSGKTELGAKS